MHFKYLLVYMWWIPFIVPSYQDELCGIFNSRTIYLQLGENGSINHRNQTWDIGNPSRCSMELVTCPSCSIQITINHMNLSQKCAESPLDKAANISSEQCSCSFLTIWEPSGHSPPQHLCEMTNDNASVFTSSTRSVGISFDLLPQNWTGSFHITFISQRNQRYVTGKIGQDGELTSPDFPSLYPRDFGMEHIISCEQEDCIIFLIFVDFLISPTSIMEFYNSDGKPIQLVSGLIARPKPVLSSGPSLIIRFFGNGGTSMGYKALYYFVTQGSWLSSNVNTDCGGEVDSLGGTIYMTDVEGYYDCIWTIQPAPSISHFKTHIFMKVVDYTEGELIIQHGLTSESRIIEKFSDENHPSIEHVTPIAKGFYISFRGTLTRKGRLVIAYSAFSYMDCMTGSDLLCSNKRCISKQLMCDSIDNCGDNSDEAGDCKPENEYRTGQFWWPLRGVGTGGGQGANGALLALGAALAGACLLLAAGVCRLALKVRPPPSSHATHHMDHARTIAHLLNIAELDERDEPPTYEPPPEYNQVVKPARPRRKHSTQRLIDRDVSTPPPQCTEDSAIPSSSMSSDIKKQFVNLPPEKIPEMLSNALLRMPDSSPPMSLDTTGFNEPDLGLSLTLSTSSHKAENSDSNLAWLSTTAKKQASGLTSPSNLSAVSFDTLYSTSGHDLSVPPLRLVKSQSQDNILWLRSASASNPPQEASATTSHRTAEDQKLEKEIDKRSTRIQRSLDDTNLLDYSLSLFTNDPLVGKVENING